MALERFECLKELAKLMDDETISASLAIGATNFEWWHLRPADTSLPIGVLGGTVALGLGIALALPHRKVVVISSDGDLCMELGQLPPLAELKPKNLTVVVLDNESYESLGEGHQGYRPTHTAFHTDLSAISRACGIKNSITVHSLEDFVRETKNALDGNGPSVVVAKTKKAKSKAPVRSIDGFEDKYRFVRYIERTEKVRIIPEQRSKKHLVQDSGE